MRNAIASQLVCHNHYRFTLVIFQPPLEETLCSGTVTTGLEKHINHSAILVNSPPQVLLLTTNLHKYFFDVECIAKSLMPTLQPFMTKNPENTDNRYSEDFRREAVRRTKDLNTSAAEMARALCRALQQFLKIKDCNYHLLSLYADRSIRKCKSAQRRSGRHRFPHHWPPRCQAAPTRHASQQHLSA